MSHVAHRLDVLTLVVCQLLLKCLELCFEYINVAIDMVNVFLYAVDILLPLINLTVKSQQIVESFFYISLVLA